MNSIVDFASEDLLSTEHIMEIVREQDMARMLVDYLNQHQDRVGQPSQPRVILPAFKTPPSMM